MQPLSFTATSAEEAVAQIRAKLGPEAVVLNVRPLPANGIARLWQKPMIEVLAYRPEEPTPPAPQAPAAPQLSPAMEVLAEFRQQLDEIKQRIEQRNQPAEIAPVSRPATNEPSEPGDSKDGQWRIGSLLRQSGLLPLHTQFIIDRLRSLHGELPPPSLAEEIRLAKTLFTNLWKRSSPIAAHSTHVLVGPAGSGKTTTLCKWLTQASLMEGRMARVWRLDGPAANLAESLSVYCEILRITCERAWQPGQGPIAEDIGFIDLPGVDWRNALALKELGAQIKQFGSPRIHLVLNGAYDSSILAAQIRAFSVLPIEDLIITHLDEETRWGKLWNLVLGTNCSIHHFSHGQNIPGDFTPATAEMLLARQFARK